MTDVLDEQSADAPDVCYVSTFSFLCLPLQNNNTTTLLIQIVYWHPDIFHDAPDGYWNWFKKNKNNKTLFLRYLHYVALITVMKKKMFLVYSHISYIVLSVVIKS